MHFDLSTILAFWVCTATFIGFVPVVLNYIRRDVIKELNNDIRNEFIDIEESLPSAISRLSNLSSIEFVPDNFETAICAMIDEKDTEKAKYNQTIIISIFRNYIIEYLLVSFAFSSLALVTRYLRESLPKYFSEYCTMIATNVFLIFAFLTLVIVVVEIMKFMKYSPKEKTPKPKFFDVSSH